MDTLQEDVLLAESHLLGETIATQDVQIEVVIITTTTDQEDVFKTEDHKIIGHQGDVPIEEEVTVDLL